MEAVPEVQISLDSVVQKASDLEGILRSCKARLCESREGGGGGWGSVETQDWHNAQFDAESTADEPQLQERDTSPKWAVGSPTVSLPPPVPVSAHPPPRPPPSRTTVTNAAGANDAATTAAWQKLTSYIVGLEKEVRHYRKLVEDLQAREVYSQQLAGYLPQVHACYNHFCKLQGSLQ